MTDKALITADTKVATLLKDFPELEELLISIAPPFKKLRNPLLRRSVAKVASLKQAAAVAKLPVGDVVARLREAVGQPPLAADEQGADQDYFTPEPEWFSSTSLVATMVEAELDDDVMPLGPLLRRAIELQSGEMIELVTAHLPAPGIDTMRDKGYLVWPRQDGDEIRTYFAKG